MGFIGLMKLEGLRVRPLGLLALWGLGFRDMYIYIYRNIAGKTFMRFRVFRLGGKV